MDTRIIREYGEEILSYRLRTARQKKRAVYEDFDKRLIQLYKEEKALDRQKRNLGWEPLIPPVQKGWKRSFVLRDDVARSKHAEFFQHILDRINTRDWSYRKDFKVKKKRFGKKRYIVKAQKLLQPWEWQFEKLGLSDAEKQMFHEELHYEKWNKGPVKRFVFNEPWRFVLRVKPNMITKIKKIDPELESRLEEIENYMKRNAFRRRLSRILYGRHKYRYWKWSGQLKFDEVDPFANKSLHQILNMIGE